MDTRQNDAPDDPATDEPPYLLYTGSIYYLDIARIVVDIAARLQRNGIPLGFVFTGGGVPERFDEIREYASQHGVLDRFVFTGYVSDEKLDTLMHNATALLAPIPENLQSIARFPTKLGYYLASGRPVITNAVGDVQTYLTDGVNACIATAYDPESFAEKIVLLLDDPGLAARIGARARKLAFDTFHYRNATRGISTFLRSFAKDTASAQRLQR